MSFIEKLIATLHGDNPQKNRRVKKSFHRQQFEVMKRWNQPVISGWSH